MKARALATQAQISTPVEKGEGRPEHSSISPSGVCLAHQPLYVHPGPVSPKARLSLSSPKEDRTTMTLSLLQ